MIDWLDFGFFFRDFGSINAPNSSEARSSSSLSSLTLSTFTSVRGRIFAGKGYCTNKSDGDDDGKGNGKDNRNNDGNGDGDGNGNGNGNGNRDGDDDDTNANADAEEEDMFADDDADANDDKDVPVNDACKVSTVIGDITSCCPAIIDDVVTPIIVLLLSLRGITAAAANTVVSASFNLFLVHSFPFLRRCCPIADAVFFPVFGFII